MPSRNASGASRAGCGCCGYRARSTGRYSSARRRGLGAIKRVRLGSKGLVATQCYRLATTGESVW